VSNDGKLELFDLRPFTRKLVARLGRPAVARLRLLTLHPPRAVFGPSFGPDVPDGRLFTQGHGRTTDEPGGWIDLVNPSPYTRRARVQGVIGSDEIGEAQLVFPGGARVRAPLGGQDTPFLLTVKLAPGANRVQLVSDLKASPRVKTYIDIRNFRLMDADAYSLALEGAGESGS
jgi:hypothetical protein